MLLDHNKFVVKAQTKGFSSKISFEILDGDSGQIIGTAKDTTAFFASLFGSAKFEVFDATESAPVFKLSRSGWLMKKDQVFGREGELVGTFKVKSFSLSGGYDVYDRSGKHLASIQGKLLSAEFKFVTPDKSAEMGSVSRTWSGLANSLLTGGESYGVQINPNYAGDTNIKMLLLGAAIAVESIFKKKAAKSSEGGGVTRGSRGADE